MNILLVAVAGSALFTVFTVLSACLLSSRIDDEQVTYAESLRPASSPPLSPSYDVEIDFDELSLTGSA